MGSAIVIFTEDSVTNNNTLTNNLADIIYLPPVCDCCRAAR